jgi:hypothetical protein
MFRKPQSFFIFSRFPISRKQPYIIYRDRGSIMGMLCFHEVPFFEVSLLLPDGIELAHVGHEIVKGY